ncbi:acyl-CoA N-acyltransferase [Legionella wadsworthii]|uniref:Acyl-CoA N-acyltransferase n=1 Tax=Legionella wadsworthii TaxID=28088 RepID=A0A378P2S0_9GAMM|nr:GNAT family N-acetyltransferase [Legionella wadsworthii]STY78870.1 acyl-CoA N-acyltransferase [Legionella wadsworthii]
MIQIEKITGDLAQSLSRTIQMDLPEYFGLPEANEHYAIGVTTRTNFAAKDGDNTFGLVSIDFPYPDNANIYWMAVKRDYHRQGVGKQLIKAACHFAATQGAKTITVETLSPSELEENYLKTYRFYQSVGFNALFDLKPAGYEWNMVYMMKQLEPIEVKQQSIRIKPLELSDIPVLVDAFQKANWQKPYVLFEGYHQEQLQSERVVWVAYVQDQIAGYVTLKWASHYESFAHKGIPEIMDLNVLPAFRKHGIASALLTVAEDKAATQFDVVGIGVGLYGGPDGGYGQAQRLYVNRGYIPDGLGVTYDYKLTIPGETYPLDDDLILWFTKKLTKNFHAESDTVTKKTTDSCDVYVPNTKYKLEFNAKDSFKIIDQKLFEFNKSCVSATQKPEVIDINVTIKNGDEVIAGICSEVYTWKILYISVFFVEEKYRNQGLGTILLNKVEEKAKELGVTLIHLDTFEFQAKDFYLKHGYEEFGVLDDCPKGHKRYYMKKVL